MNQRRQRIVFWVMMVCIIAMAVFLAMQRKRGRDRVQALGATTLLDAPAGATSQVTLDIANDATGAISSTARDIALPDAPNARARTLIDHLIAEYSQPGSAHPLPPVTPVAEVFLLPVAATDHDPVAQPAHHSRTVFQGIGTNAPAGETTDAELAVVDLRSAFVNQHPSGVEVESLTLLSIVKTLRTNLPQIEQVRFLVDGQARETLAGHADLLKTYTTSGTSHTSADHADVNNTSDEDTNQ
jgi:hypothetical protein